jgi:type II secretory pathway component PulF
MDLTEGSETSAKLRFFIQPLKMDLTEGSETSEKLNQMPGKYPKENIQVSEHGENLKSRIKVTSLTL